MHLEDAFLSTNIFPPWILCLFMKSVRETTPTREIMFTWMCNLPLTLKEYHNNLLLAITYDLHMFRFKINLASCLKVQKVGDIFKIRDQCTHPRILILGIPSPWVFTLHIKFMFISSRSIEINN